MLFSQPIAQAVIAKRSRHYRQQPTLVPAGGRITLCFDGFYIATGMAFKVVAVCMPITVESQLPWATSRKADNIISCSTLISSRVLRDCHCLD
jgi:hypothetical protein